MSQYTEFRNLHNQPSPLLLANVWDVPTAKMAEESGYAAVGTSSAAVAATLGYGDGEQLPFRELLFMVEHIIKSITLPLSVDIESGYGDNPELIIDNIVKLANIGVVGINIEDSKVQTERMLLPVSEFQQTLKAIKSGLLNRAIEIFINVRTDTYLLKVDNVLNETLHRIGQYEAAGVDGIFVPCLTNAEEIRQISAASKLPLNIMCMPDLPNFSILKDNGVRRISAGNFVHGSMSKSLKVTLEHILADQSFNRIFN